MKHISRLSGLCFFAALLLVFALLICSCAPEEAQPIPVYENSGDNALEEPTGDTAEDRQESEEREEPPPSPRFGIYNGAGSWEPNVEVLINFLDSYGYEWHFFNETEAVEADLSAKFDVIWFPGGFAAEYEHYIAGEENISSFMAEGGIFIGSCAGAYYASDILRWSGTDYHYPLSLFEGKAVGPLSGLISWGSQSEIILNEEHPANHGFPASFEMTYCDGPYFEPYPDSRQEVEILASYAVNGEPAIIICHTGTGAALLLGPHPELSVYNPADSSFDLTGDNGAQWPWLHSVLQWLLQER